MGLGIGEVARALGCDPTMIRRAVKMGTMTRNPDGSFDLETARREYSENIEHYAPREARRNLEEMASSTPEIPEKPKSGSEYVKAKTATQIYDARLKKLRYEKIAGKLAPTADIEAARFREMRIIRDACLNIPSRLAAQLAVETSEHKIYQLLENEIIEAFAAYADGREIKEAV